MDGQVRAYKSELVGLQQSLQVREQGSVFEWDASGGAECRACMAE